MTSADVKRKPHLWDEVSKRTQWKHACGTPGSIPELVGAWMPSAWATLLVSGGRAWCR